MSLFGSNNTHVHNYSLNIKYIFDLVVLFHPEISKKLITLTVGQILHALNNSTNSGENHKSSPILLFLTNLLSSWEMDRASKVKTSLKYPLNAMIKSRSFIKTVCQWLFSKFPNSHTKCVISPKIDSMNTHTYTHNFWNYFLEGLGDMEWHRGAEV